MTTILADVTRIQQVGSQGPWHCKQKARGVQHSEAWHCNAGSALYHERLSDKLVPLSHHWRASPVLSP